MLQISDLHRQAQSRLAATQKDPKKLALIHTAIALGCSFLLTVVTYLFSLLIANTGGLGGLATRSVLTTAQTLLEMLVMIALPFWQMGIYYAALQWAEGETADFGSLLHGFCRFRSVLGALFLRSALFIALGVAVFNISSVLFSLTPFSASFMELLTPIAVQGTTPEQLEALMTPEFIDSFMHASLPLLIIFGILYVVAFIPLFYRLRFTDFAVMDDFTTGKAFLKSLVITRQRFWQLLKLDLSFWWFYLLQLLTVAICYADSILPVLGIPLPFSPTVSAFLFYAVGSVCQALLLWQYEAKRVTVYGLAYRTLDGTLDGEEGDMQA